MHTLSSSDIATPSRRMASKRMSVFARLPSIPI